MRRALVASIVLVAGTAWAAPEPVVRVRIDAGQPVLVGQLVRMEVTVFAPNFFLSPPRFPALDVAGAAVQLLDESFNTSETIDGVEFAGIHKVYAITAERPGELSVPPAEITFQYAAEPGKPGVAGSVTLPAQRLTATLPAGAAAAVQGSRHGAGRTAPVARVELQQTLDRDLKGLKVGDTLTRTIDAFAANTQPMMIPPPHLDAPEGIRVYPRDPVLTVVTGGRGEFIGGRRVDRATYTFEKPGRFTLPGVDVGWVDPASGKPETSSAPRIDVVVAPNPDLQPAIAPEAAPTAEAVGAIRRRAWWLAGFAAGAALLAIGVRLVRRYLPRYRTSARARRRRREGSEEAYFARAITACGAGDPADAYAAIVAWSRRVGAASLASLGSANAEFATELAALERRLYATSAPSAAWDGRAIIAAARRIRHDLLAERQAASAHREALPALNP